MAINHVAVEVPEPDEIFEALTERTSCPVVDPPTTLATDDVESRYVFVEDPDGHLIELVERSVEHPTNEWQ